MLKIRRIFLLGAVACGLAACAGPAPKESALDTASRSSIAISDVVVDVSKMGGKTQGRPVPSSSVEALVEREAAAQLKGQGTGNRKARAVLSIDSVNIITAGQSILLGGESIMSGTVALVDARTGQTILAPTKLSSGGGGWVAGGVIAAATRDDSATELRQLSNEFVARARILTIGDPVASATRSASSASSTEVTKATASPQGAELKAAIRRAELEARAKHDPTCHTLACERDVIRARQQAIESFN